MKNLSKEQKEKFRDLIIAHEFDAAIIQFVNREGNWECTEYPYWDISIEYRIKPNQKYIPFTMNDFKMFEGKFVRYKLLHGNNNITHFQIAEIGESYIKSNAGNYISFEMALNDIEFADGTPFGKLFEENDSCNKTFDYIKEV